MRSSAASVGIVLTLIARLMAQDPVEGVRSTVVPENATPKLDIVEYQGQSQKIDAWSESTSVQLQGEIKQLDGGQLVIIEAGGAPRTIPSEQIIRVAPFWRNAAAQQVHQQFVEGNTKEVVKGVLAALKVDLCNGNSGCLFPSWFSRSTPWAILGRPEYTS